MKFFSAKIFNIVTIALSVIFFLSVFVTTVASIQEEGRMALEFERMLENAETFNYKHSLEVSAGEVGEEIELEEGMFNNATDAFIHAYYNYANAKTYHVVSSGVTTNSILGLSIITHSKNVMIKYEDGSAVYELISYEPGNKYGRTTSLQIYYDSPTQLVYMRETTNVKKVGDDLVTTYSTPWEYAGVDYFVTEIGIMPGESIYNFSKEAVINENYYKEIREDGVIKEYHIQVESNPKIAGAPFARVAKYIGDAIEMPTIDKMRTGAIIDGEGRLKVLSFNDEFTVKTKVAGITQTVKCKSNATYNFITIGGKVITPKPNVSNSIPM
jgi:hypothetical protein